jgi:MFS family permease
VAILFAAYEFFLRTFLGSLAQQIMSSWHLTVLQFSDLNSAYYFAYGLMQLPVGLLVGRYGVKRSLMFAASLLVFSTLLFAHSDLYALALTARVLMGVGSSFAFICMFELIMKEFSDRYHGSAIGASQFITTLGPLLAGGPLVIFIHHFHLSWQVAIDYVGFFGLLFVLLSFCIASDNRKNCHSLAVNSVGLSWWSQIRTLLTNRQGLCIAIYSGITYVSVVVLAAFWGTRYLQACGFTQEFSSSMISLVWLSMAIACPLVGWLSDHMQRKRLFFISCASVGLVATSSLLLIDSQSHMWCVMMVFIGLGIGVSAQSLGYVKIVAVFPRELSGAALGLNNVGIYVFNILVPFVVSLLIKHSHAQHGGLLKVTDFRVGFMVLPVLYVLALLLALWFMRDRDTRCLSGSARSKILDNVHSI